MSFNNSSNSNFGYKVIDSKEKVIKKFVSNSRFYNPSRIGERLRAMYDQCKVVSMNKIEIEDFLQQ